MLQLVGHGDEIFHEGRSFWEEIVGFDRFDFRRFLCSTPQKHRQWLSSIFETPKPLKHENHP